jgi:group I intron endonuclease
LLRWKLSKPRKEREHSEETKAKIALAFKGKKNWLGKTHSDDTRGKISKAKKGITLPNFTLEHKLAISAALKGNKNASKGLGRQRPEGAGSPSVQIKALDMKTRIQTIYPSMSETAKALGVPSGSIRMYFSRNTQKLYKDICYKNLILHKNNSANICKRATSRWFFNRFIVRCTLVAGKPVFGRN